MYSENSTSKWDDGAEGNYWGDYSGKDSDMDGFGDAPYAIDENNQDNHPLMGLFSDYQAVWQEATYHVALISTSRLSGFRFSQPDKTISFSFNNPDNASGFCRMSVPTTLLGGPYTLVLDGLPSTNLTERSDGTLSFLYFTYSGVHSVEVKGTSVVPEFPSIFLVFLLVAVTAWAAIVALARARRRLVPALSG